MKLQQPPAPSPRPLRILEIGGNELFACAVPQQTELYWTGIKRRSSKYPALGPIRMMRNLLRLRRGEFDLLAVHSTQYAPWHPRSFLTTLRDWHLRSPLGLFANFAWRFVHLFHDVPIVVIDLNDTCHISRHNFFLLDSSKAFFKLHLLSDHWLSFCKSSYPNFPGRRWRSNARNRRRVAKLKPLGLVPYSFPFAEMSDAPEKHVDIFFAGEIASNSTARTVGIEELRELEREGYVVDLPAGKLARPEFMRRMSAAWLAWSPGGFVWDCYRHYEAPLVGSVPLMNYPSTTRHRPLLDGEHCVLYRIEPGGLREAARDALADKARLRKMAAAAAAHVRRYHSQYARAEYVASTVLGRRLDGTLIEPGEASASGEQAANIRARAGSFSG